jgi:hypothetical protein
MVARLGLQPRQEPPVDMLWRRTAVPEPARRPVYPRSVAKLAPVLNLHLNVRPLLVQHQREGSTARPIAPLTLLTRNERTGTHTRELERTHERSRERLVLSPPRQAAREEIERPSRLQQTTAERVGAPELRPHANVAHAFDRLLVRGERVTHEQTVECLLRRSRRVEESTPVPALTLPKPAVLPKPSSELETRMSAAQRQTADPVERAQAKALQDQWAASLDPNRLADQVLREMDRRLIARKERFGRV